jgi:hypothetical protein
MLVLPMRGTIVCPLPHPSPQYDAQPEAGYPSADGAIPIPVGSDPEAEEILAWALISIGAVVVVLSLLERRGSCDGF